MSKLTKSDKWPEDWQLDLYHDLNNSKFNTGRRRDPEIKVRVKPPVFPFALLESVEPHTLDKLLTAASIAVKKVKRYPGWILQNTYNLKSRPIQII